jgi:GcrA cell cycle regulator
MKEPSWWTEDRVTELRTRYANGESGSQIGIAMHAKSRNAVVGKLYRLGLRRQVPIGAKTELKPSRAKRNTVHHIDGRIFFRGDAVTEPEPPQLTNPKLLIELEPCDCRWPGTGSGAEMLYCGAPALNGYSYCVHHCRIAFQPRLPRMPRL